MNVHSGPRYRCIQGLFQRGVRSIRSRLNGLLFVIRSELLRQPPYVARYFGFELLYGSGDILVRQYAASGHYEPHVISFVKGTLPPGSVVIDVGANIGLFSLAVLASVPQSTVHMFEPSPVPRGLLSQTLKRNAFGDRVRLNAAALYSEVGEMDFYVHAGKHAALDGLRDTRYATVGDASCIRVPVTTLDSYVKQSAIQRLDLLKLDAEGAELSILQGATVTLRTLRPTVLFEAGMQNLTPYNVTPSELYQFFAEHGYQVVTLRGVSLSESEFRQAIDKVHEFAAVPSG